MALTPERIKELWDVYRAALPRYLCFAKAIEAEVRKQDEALIRQLVDALEGSIAITMVKIDMRNAALTSGRAWLEGKP